MLAHNLDDILSLQYSRMVSLLFPCSSSQPCLPCTTWPAAVHPCGGIYSHAYIFAMYYTHSLNTYGTYSLLHAHMKHCMNPHIHPKPLPGKYTHKYVFGLWPWPLACTHYIALWNLSPHSCSGCLPLCYLHLHVIML